MVTFSSLFFKIFFIGLDDKEKIQRQKLLLNKRLGLDGPAAEGLELFDDEDLRTTDDTKISATPSVSVGYLLLNMVWCYYLYKPYIGMCFIAICFLTLRQSRHGR